jgi:hypothetical protein
MLYEAVKWLMKENDELSVRLAMIEEKLGINILEKDNNI